MSENDETNQHLSTENGKYLTSKYSVTKKKFELFNRNRYVPEGKTIEEVIQKAWNRIDKRKRLNPNNNEFKAVDGFEGKNKTIEQIDAIKIYNNKNIEISSRNEKNKERKEKTYLKMGKNTNDILFASRLFNFIDCPTFNAYLSTNNEPLFEMLDGDNKYSVLTYYQDEKTARQFIRRNITANFFNDDDAHLSNVMYNEKTGEVKHIDLNIQEPIVMFSMLDILRGKGGNMFFRKDKYVLDMSDDTEMLRLCEESKPIELRLRELKPKELESELEDLKIKESEFKKFKENNKMSNSDYVNIIKDEYFDLQKKMFLIDDKDLDSIALSNDEELSKDDNFLEEAAKFKKNIKLHQVKSFHWIYGQGNLHKLFDLSEEYEQKLHDMFNIDKIFKEIEDFDLKKDEDIGAFLEKNKKYNNILNSISETVEFKNFICLANSFSKKIEKENYQSLDELFFDNKISLKNALDNSNNFSEFIEKFNNSLGLKSSLDRMIQELPNSLNKSNNEEESEILPTF